MEHYAGRRSDWIASAGSFWLELAPRVLVLGFLFVLLVGTGRWLYASLGFSPPPPEDLIEKGPRVETFTATVISRVAKGVGSPFGGWIQEVRVRPGQRVTRGQLLFRMNTGELERRLRARALTERQASAAALAPLPRRRMALAPVTQRIRRLERDLAALRRAARRVERENANVQLTEGRERREKARQSALCFAPSPAEGAHSLRLARQEKKRLYHRYHLEIVAALQSRNATRKDVAHLKSLLAQAKRYSPIDGVVTDLRRPTGSWVDARRPVVRVDDPAGYRLVLLIRERRARALTPEAELNLGPGTQSAVLEQKLPGWGRELFFTWLTLRPASPGDLKPGERLAVRILPARAGNTGTAPAG